MLEQKNKVVSLSDAFAHVVELTVPAGISERILHSALEVADTTAGAAQQIPNASACGGILSTAPLDVLLAHTDGPKSACIAGDAVIFIVV